MRNVAHIHVYRDSVLVYREPWILENKWVKLGLGNPRGLEVKMMCLFQHQKSSLSHYSWHGVAPTGLCGVMINLGEIQAAFYLLSVLVLDNNAGLEQVFKTRRGKGQEDAWNSGTGWTWAAVGIEMFSILMDVSLLFVLPKAHCKKMHWTPVTAWWEEIVLIPNTNNSFASWNEAADVW